MPKRRMTALRKAQIRLWQQASYGRSRTNPIPAKRILQGRLGEPATQPGSFGHVRRHKLGGKAYQKKAAGAVHVADEAKAILAGKQGFRSQLAADMGHQGPAKVPRIKASWRSKNPSPQAKAAAQLQKSKAKIQPSKVHGSGTGLSAAFRYGRS